MNFAFPVGKARFYSPCPFRIYMNYILLKPLTNCAFYLFKHNTIEYFSLSNIEQTNKYD